MDLNLITDIDKLQSMAYTNIVQIEASQENLRLINQRLQQVRQEQVEEAEKEAPKKAKKNGEK